MRALGEWLAGLNQTWVSPIEPWVLGAEPLSLTAQYAYFFFTALFIVYLNVWVRPGIVIVVSHVRVVSGVAVAAVITLIFYRVLVGLGVPSFALENWWKFIALFFADTLVTTIVQRPIAARIGKGTSLIDTRMPTPADTKPTLSGKWDWNCNWPLLFRSGAYPFQVFVALACWIVTWNQWQAQGSTPSQNAFGSDPGFTGGVYRLFAALWGWCMEINRFFLRPFIPWILGDDPLAFLAQFGFLFAMTAILLYWILWMRRETVVILSQAWLVGFTVFVSATNFLFYRLIVALELPVVSWENWWQISIIFVGAAVVYQLNNIIVGKAAGERVLTDTQLGVNDKWNCNWPLIPRCANQANLALVGIGCMSTSLQVWGL